ncbi:MAG: hypothetical protein EOO73_08770 [Myxococcales bacterium]|nr:MAG: hypothetical protein EOO73_08770 [Myxococcales bacterium]
MSSRSWFGIGVVTALTALGCTPGYMKASELEARGQGPSACVKSCEDLNMRMAALVLVGDSLPGCVCQPVNVQGAPIKTSESAPAGASLSEEAAAASTTGYVVLAAAAAAREQQRQQQQLQQQQSYSKKN